MTATHDIAARPASNISTRRLADSKTLLLVIVLLGTILRFAALDRQSLWLDEAYSLHVASADSLSILTGSVGDRYTPPFYYLLLHGWMNFGTSEVALRSLSAVFDVACIVAIFLLGSALFGRQIGLISAVLVALSPFHIYFAQEARMYTLVAALTMMATYMFVQGLDRDDPKIWAGYVVCMTLAMYTHYYAIFILATHTIYGAIFRRRDRGWIRKWMLVQALVVISFLPWIGGLLQVVQGGGQTFRQSLYSSAAAAALTAVRAVPYTFFRFSAGYALLPTNYWMRENVIAAIRGNLPIVVLVLVVFAPLAVYGISRALARDARVAVLTLLVLLFPGFAALLISLRFPIFGERYLIVSAPAYFMFLAVGLRGWGGKLWRWLAGAGVGVVFGLSLHSYYFSADYGKEQWREAVAYIETQGQPADLVLFDANYVRWNFDYYVRRSFPEYGLPDSQDGVPDRVLATVKGRDRIWLVRAHQPSEFWTSWLMTRYHLVNEKIFPLQTGIRIYKFEPLADISS